jgi:hypothetical protein
MSSYQVSEDFLLNHAYRNVWCTPEQDKQAILQLPRITPQNGVWTYFNYQWRKVQLPVTGNAARFHVYQVGKVHPTILGLLNKKNQWVSAKEVMETECMLLEVYNSKGIMIPRSLIWYIVMGNGNLLVAVRKPAEFPTRLVDVDLESEDIFMRLYSNAYFNSIRATYPEGCIKVKSIKPDNISQIQALQGEIQKLPSYGGKFFYINGRRVEVIDLVTAKIGDYIEYVFDASVKREVAFKVRNLQEFQSELDTLSKYLLHYPGKSGMIDYQDDIDLYLGAYSTRSGKWRGAYVHKNDSRTMRMVTHRDYSVPVIRINGTQAANPFLVEQELELRMTIRHSGYERPLVFENSRIVEMYKLPEERLAEAMLGLDSTVSVWEAAKLEASAYTALMRQPQGGITRQLVQQAYGYNAMSTLLASTPTEVVVEGNSKTIVIPEGLRGHCTVYEYDKTGRLLYYTTHTQDNTYVCQADDTAFAEVIYGLGGLSLDVQDDVAIGNLDPLQNYRFYTAKGAGGVRTGEWRDVTGDPEYLVTGRQYQWVTETGSLYRVLSNKNHLAYTFEMAPIAGVFEFDIGMQKNGVFQKLDMPLGELDLFFNGHSLIEGLDYVVQGSRVVIATKKYYDPKLAKQSITVRYTGFCNKDMHRTLPAEVGFVFHGNLSANNRFDIHDDKVLRIVCAGGVRLRKDLDFAEDGISVSMTNALNGAPYAIRDIIVPMNNYLVGSDEVSDHTYEYREQAMKIDQEISDYMTRFLPEQVVTAPNAINGRYTLYSPYLGRIIDDLKSGVLNDDKFYEHFGEDWLRTRLAKYEPLLAFDPFGTGMDVDDRYVVVHPHMYPNQVSLTIYQYRVLSKIVEMLKANVDLSSTINVLQF